MIDFEDKKWTIPVLKGYLRQNGHEKLSGKKKGELRQMAFNTEKGKALQEEENSLCEECKKNIDDCECERCDECFEISKNCFCEQKKERKQKMQKVKQAMMPFQNLLQQFSKPKQEIVTPPLKVIEKPKPKKKIVKKIIKKKQKRKVVSIDIDDDLPDLPKLTLELQELKIKVEPPKIDEFDIETELQLTALKIKIKLFISEKIENKKSVQQDVFHLLYLLLKKHGIILNENEKTIFPKIFQRIYKEPLYKQKTILKDIVVYLIECDTKSFSSLL